MAALVTGEGGDGSDVRDSKKLAVTERLKKREDERTAALQQRRADKQSDILVEETTDHFRKQFSDMKSQVEDGLHKADSISEISRPPHFDNLTLLVQSMQKFLTDSAHFLSTYNIQSAQETINQLKDSIHSRRVAVAPKKKFAFKGGKKKSAVDGGDKTDSAAQGSSPNKPKHKSVHSSATSALPDNTTELKDRQNERLTLSADQLAGRHIILTALHSCTVTLHGPMLALTADRLTDCQVSCGPVSTSVFVDASVGCQFSVACQQLRVHTTSRTSFYLHVTSRAIIEDCHGIETAPYSLQYKGLEEQFLVAGLDKNRNNWDDIDDFDWLATDKPSPNWSVMNVGKRIEWKC